MTTLSSSADYMREAIALAIEGVEQNRGGPFGAVIVRAGLVVGRGCNLVVSTNDPTAHAEIVAIRDACSRLATFDLTGCELYTTCEPCPMCLAAIYWARIARFSYGCTAADAAAAGFADDFIRQELDRQPHERAIPRSRDLAEEAAATFAAWRAKPDRIAY